jgi:hypothetical protein
VISPASSAGSENILFEPVLSVEGTALMAEVDAAIPDLFIISHAGLYQEGTIRCIMDIAETYLDRPAGMYESARGKCSSLSEDPKRRSQMDMRSAPAAARPIRPLETIYEDELGDVAPMTHALFLPKEETLPSAFFLVKVIIAVLKPE